MNENNITNNAVIPNNDLPSGYCEGGFMDTDTTGKHFLKRDYVSIYAQELARKLVNGKPSMSAASFKTNFSASAKRNLSRNVSSEARMTCAASMLPRAKKLTATHKAPKVLRDMMNALLPYVKDDASFHALYTHLDAVYSEMLDLEPPKPPRGTETD